MDAATYTAASSTQFGDAGQAQQWFEVVAAGVATLDPEASWDDAAAGLREEAAAAGLDWAAEALIACLEQEGGDPTGVLRELGDREHEEEYVSAAVQSGGGDAASDPGGGYDDAAWSAYVGRWQGGWDGAEATWPQFRDGFVQSAGAQLQQAAQELVAYAEASSDKVAALAPYGIAAAAPADAAASAAAAAEPGEVDPAVAALDIQDDTIAEVLQENPEFAALGADALEQLMAEVLAELETEEEAG